MTNVWIRVEYVLLHITLQCTICTRIASYCINVYGAVIHVVLGDAVNRAFWYEDEEGRKKKRGSRFGLKC